MKIREHLEKLIPLYYYDELTEAEKQELEVHLEYCENCRRQFEEMGTFYKLLDNKVQHEPTEELLLQSRLKLRERLIEERRAAMKESWRERIVDFIKFRNVGFQLAGALSLLLVGILLGRYVWNEKPPMFLSDNKMTAFFDQDLREQPLINNIDQIRYDPASGKVTVRYKSVSDVLIQGNIEDEQIRSLLVHAIRSEEHPGRRLTAVKAFGGHTFSDDEVEKALIYAVEHDAVNGVRLKAAKVLKTLPINQKIKNVFVRILLKDTNTAMRIEAIEALSNVKEEEKDVLPILQDASRDDENEFIRLKAAKELERRDNPKFDQKDDVR